jgi:hypothetical protein
MNPLSLSAVRQHAVSPRFGMNSGGVDPLLLVKADLNQALQQSQLLGQSNPVTLTLPSTGANIVINSKGAYGDSRFYVSPTPPIHGIQGATVGIKKAGQHYQVTNIEPHLLETDTQVQQIFGIKQP